jgi:acetylornithine deacetylase/succinyl-diaminopimelate desuccinylase-like protein
MRVSPEQAAICSGGARPWEAGVNWSSVGEEAIDLLRGYLRFPTVNDPGALSPEEARDQPWRAGREADAAGWLAGLLKVGGVAAEVLESAPGRTSLVARLGSAGKADSVTLLSHIDVVPALSRDWGPGTGPFEGVIQKGFLYGRGALDLKGLGIAQLIVLLLLKRLKLPLQRDVVLLMLADEEAGGSFGAEWLLRERPEFSDTDVVLGEGAYSLEGLLPGGGPVHAVSVGEKGYLELELTVDGRAHHSAMPEPASAPARLIQALSGLLRMKRQVRLNPVTSELLQRLHGRWGRWHRIMLRCPFVGTRLLDRHSPHGILLSSLLTDTIALTALDAGEKNNTVPGSARAVLSIRFLPGTDPDALEDEIRNTLRDSAVRIKRLMYKPSTVTGADTAYYRTLEKHAAASARDASVTPIVSPGASDCRFWRLRNRPCYGWVPFFIPATDLHTVHGANERISLSSFQDGLKSLFAAVAEMATAPVPKAR